MRQSEAAKMDASIARKNLNHLIVRRRDHVDDNNNINTWDDEHLMDEATKKWLTYEYRSFQQRNKSATNEIVKTQHSILEDQLLKKASQSLENLSRAIAEVGWKSRENINQNIKDRDSLEPIHKILKSDDHLKHKAIAVGLGQKFALVGFSGNSRGIGYIFIYGYQFVPGIGFIFDYLYGKFEITSG